MKKAMLLAVLVLVGCGAKQEPLVVFAATNCTSTPSEELRQREVKTRCTLRAGTANPYNHAKPCISWAHATITERRYTLACQRAEWKQEAP